MEQQKKPAGAGASVARAPRGEARYVPHGGAAYRLVKAVFDWGVALCAGIVTLLPLLILMLVIVLKDPGPPLYFHKRIGKDGRTIRVAKLRTMHAGGDEPLDALTEEQIWLYRREYKLHDDPRLIGYVDGADNAECFGAVLRRWAVDELPQLLYNICFKRNMSLVGPRPILREEMEQNYTLEERIRLCSVKPGLTGYWKAYAPWEATYENGKRQAMELYYVDHRSAWLDLKILFATLRSLGRKPAWMK